MRAFMVLCFVALATADKLGYNYQPVGHSDSGLSFIPGSGSSGGLPGSTGGLGGIGGGLGGLGSGPSSGFGGLGGVGGPSGGSSGSFGNLGNGLGGLGGGLGGGPSGSFGNLGNGLGGLGGGLGGLGGGPSYGIDGGSSSGPSGPSDYSGGSSGSALGSSSSVGAPAEAEYEKEFYTYTADESDFNEPESNDQVANSLKKNLRVIFIKGPENNGLEKAAINLAKHASEQKTAIYVLQKQADLGDLANKLQVSHDLQSHKPEVHFVKYRTPEDAANAQKAIQSQYDQLDGPSQSHDGGAAPVHNFASPAARNAPSGDSDGISGPAGGISGDAGRVGGVPSGLGSGGRVSGGKGPAAPRATYLPAAILRAFRF
ncbi:pupal cuticle protein 36-like [Anastrepha obliqua]|uniref:pupal cuticle protein 36-like n=1 Tax=Anastrepha obliqua TaxID=95512 RepID=UPI002409B214|nr:pupal cuticle protein 36-like [Anastrepha obliqua]